VKPRTPARRRWFKRWGLSDVRRLGLPVHVSEGRTLWGCALTLRVGTKRPWPAATRGLHEAGGWRREGDVASSPRLSPWGRTGTIRLKLKLACRRFQRLPGLDGPPPRDRLCKRSSVGPSPSLRNAPHLWPTERHETYSRHKSRISDRIISGLSVPSKAGQRLPESRPGKNRDCAAQLGVV
jgi:hypothetical protein